jgi:integrase
MNRVIPIESDETLALIKEELKKKGTMPLLLWTFGVNTSLRISDILDIQVKDVMGDKLYLKEQKTGKRQEIVLNKGITDILEGYIKTMQPYEYLFKGRQGGNKPITRQRASQIIKEAVKAVGLNPSRISCHSMRKSRALRIYNQTGDIALVMKMLNHSSQAVSLRYLGIEQNIMDEVNLGLVL